MGVVRNLWQVAAEGGIDPRVIRRLQDNDWQHLTTHGPLQLWQKDR